MRTSTLGGLAVKILTRMCTSLDGRVTTADGLPVQLGFPGWDAGALGFYQVQGRCDAVLMGRTTFEPALSAPFWPWGDLAVYVLGSHLSAGAPDRVAIDDDPVRLLERLRGENKGGDVHLVGGPKTIETFRALGALDEFRLMVLPIFVGNGRHFTPDFEHRHCPHLDRNPILAKLRRRSRLQTDARGVQREHGIVMIRVPRR
jgi:dihydrofolate reductase